MANGNGNGNGNSNGYGVRWQWFMSITTAIAIVAGAMLTFFVQSSSLATTVSIDSQRIVALEHELKDVNERAAVTRSDTAALRTGLLEVETQFCGSDIIRNLMHAYDMRLLAMVWQKLNPETPLPLDNAYYPHVCKSGSG